MQAQKYTHVGCVRLCFFLLSFQAVPRERQQLKTLGATIRQYRTQAGMSQEKLAEKAELHPVYMGKVERGEQWISLHALLRVARALGIRGRDLLRDL
jgi:ribosome-binding protein aMBF1 (putative translation factor)